MDTNCDNRAYEVISIDGRNNDGYWHMEGYLCHIHARLIKISNSNDVYVGLTPIPVVENNTFEEKDNNEVGHQNTNVF